jgi:hypothetical protein
MNSKFRQEHARPCILRKQRAAASPNAAVVTARSRHRSRIGIGFLHGDASDEPAT